MHDNSKFKLGLFVCFAVALFFLCLTILGSFEQFKEKAYLTTLVSESVQGLTVGSAVKYQGVPIGTVKDITIYTSGNLIRIDMEVNLSRFKIQAPGQMPASISIDQFYDYIARDVQDGMRCWLELEGITGSKYIELNFVKDAVPSKLKPEEYALDANAYVPSVPSLISDLRGSVTTILTKLESVDYKGISDRAVAALDSADALLKSPKYDQTLDNLNGTIAEARKSIENLSKLTGSGTREKIETLTANADTAAKAVDSLAKSVETEIKSAEFAQISENIRESLANFIRTSRALDETLFKVNNGVDALIELIQYLDSDPSALVHGKKKQPLFQSGDEPDQE